MFFTLNREDFSFVIHLDRQPRTSRRREAQTGSRARSGSRSERILDAVEHSRTLMEWWPFLIFHRGGLQIKVINNTSLVGHPVRDCLLVKPDRQIASAAQPFVVFRPVANVVLLLLRVLVLAALGILHGRTYLGHHHRRICSQPERCNNAWARSDRLRHIQRAMRLAEATLARDLCRDDTLTIVDGPLSFGPERRGLAFGYIKRVHELYPKPHAKRRRQTTTQSHHWKHGSCRWHDAPKSFTQHPARPTQTTSRRSRRPYENSKRPSRRGEQCGPLFRPLL